MVLLEGGYHGGIIVMEREHSYISYTTAIQSCAMDLVQSDDYTDDTLDDDD
jgi:hypothetical protein